MFVVDKVVDEDRQAQGPPIDPDDAPDFPESEITLPDGTTKFLGPSARDAFSVFEDLCLLANSEKPHFLKLEFLHKTFALELIESVLTNYHDLFRKVSRLFRCALFPVAHARSSIPSFSYCCNTISVLSSSKPSPIDPYSLSLSVLPASFSSS